ncbi:MAG: hypothetical protein JSW49_05680 [candidate division WOR-3 bacterium]|nr:MAG: hypothetical protein JSW49_05680 [candidate division WOR-3 bacterium]
MKDLQREEYEKVNKEATPRYWRAISLDIFKIGHGKGMKPKEVSNERF